MSSDREIDFLLTGQLQPVYRGMPSTRHIILKCGCGWEIKADKQLAKELNKKHLKFERHQAWVKNQGKEPPTEDKKTG